MTLDVVSTVGELDDAQLVRMGLEGHRDAFGQLVARYQSPVCALAYSRCGDISQSQDLAQETFIIAWRKLNSLQEPSKFKSWVFGIVRNLVNNASRQKFRNPLSAAEPLDENLSSNPADSNPTAQAISKEEQGILWRSLENIPEAYREPLILFYREHQSIQHVAETLELSDEVVRQRLSRGRKLLQKQVIAFVEGALEQTAPSQAFTLSVMSALPPFMVATGSSAIGGAAFKGGAAGKAIATAGVFSILLTPILWLVGAVVGTWSMAVKFPDSSRERKFTCKAWIACWIGTLLYVLGAYVFTHDVDWNAHPQRNTALLLGSCFAYCAALLVFWKWAHRVQLRIRNEEGKRPAAMGFFSRFGFYEYRSPQTLLGLPLVHVRFNGQMSGPAAKGWIAIGTKAYGILFACGGFAVGTISWGATAIGLIGLGGVGLGLLALEALPWDLPPQVEGQ